MTHAKDELSTAERRLDTLRKRRSPINADRAVEEGVLIAKTALSLELKNDVIEEALRDDRAFDEDHVAELAHGTLLELVRESEVNAERARALAEDVVSPRGSRDSENYQSADRAALLERGGINDRVADELRALSENETFLHETARTARDRAWAEIGESIRARLLAQVPIAPDRFYDQEKDARVKALYTINLRALEKRAKKLKVGDYARESASGTKR